MAFKGCLSWNQTGLTLLVVASVYWEADLKPGQLALHVPHEHAGLLEQVPKLEGIATAGLQPLQQWVDGRLLLHVWQAPAVVSATQAGGGGVLGWQ